MQRKTFGEFVDKKKRDAKKHLHLVEKLLKKSGLKTENFLDKDDDPYIFCYNPQKNTSFDGIRIYKIGNFISFRVQNESKTHPFGEAYTLPVEQIFNDFLTDHEPKEAGKRVIEDISKEVRKFFSKCVDAEKDTRRDSLEKKDDAVAARGQGVIDYSNLIYTRS